MSNGARCRIREGHRLLLAQRLQRGRQANLSILILPFADPGIPRQISRDNGRWIYLCAVNRRLESVRTQSLFECDVTTPTVVIPVVFIAAATAAATIRHGSRPLNQFRACGPFCTLEIKPATPSKCVITTRLVIDRREISSRNLSRRYSRTDSD
jgi:hypothetical protein